MFQCFIHRLPPSLNKAYLYRNGRRTLSPEARRFKSECFDEFKKGGAFPFKEGDALVLDLWFFVINLENAGWPKTKTRFKKRDITNWAKLLEDSLAVYSGIDDSANLDVLLHKRKADPMPEGIWITVTKL